MNGRTIADGLDATAHCDNLSKKRERTMENYFIFTIVYVLNGYPMESNILLDSSAKCQQVIRASEELSDALPADLFCKDTGILSKSLRPKLRPSTQSEAHQETDVCPQIDEDQCNNS